MADSWEDDDFEPPSFTVPPINAPASWEDEDEVDATVPVVAPGLAPKMSAAKAAKVAAEGDAKIAVSVESRNESHCQKLRAEGSRFWDCIICCLSSGPLYCPNASDNQFPHPPWYPISPWVGYICM
ncbi:unnamed protein product [Choristocarpus tenellus]